MPTVTCQCGRVCRFTEAQRGRKGPCPQCREPLRLIEDKPPVSTAADADEGREDDNELKIVPLVRESKPAVEDDEDLVPLKRETATPAATRKREEELSPAAGTYIPAPAKAPPKTLTKQTKAKMRREEAEVEETRGFRVSVSPGIWAALGLIIGGAIWLFLGLLADRLFLYPLYMIGLGVLRFFASLFGFEE